MKKKKRAYLTFLLNDYHDDTMKKLNSYALFLLKGDSIVSN